MASARYHHGDLRRTLLQGASDILEDEGVEALTLRGLARRVGVSHSAPAHHFPTRLHLLAELAAAGFADLADQMTEAMGQQTPQRWPEALGRVYVRYALANPSRYRLMFTSRLFAETDSERLVGESSRAYGCLMMAVDPSLAADQLPQSADNPRRVSPAELTLWSLVHGAVMLWLDGQLGSLSSSEEFLELVDGLLGTPPFAAS